MHMWFVILSIFAFSSWAHAQEKGLSKSAAPALPSAAPAPVVYDVVGGSDVVIEGRSYPVVDDKVSVPSATRDRRVRLRSRYGSIVDVAYERPTDEFLPMLESDVAEVLALGGVSFLPLSLGRLAASTSITRFEAQVRLLL